MDAKQKGQRRRPISARTLACLAVVWVLFWIGAALRPQAAGGAAPTPGGEAPAATPAPAAGQSAAPADPDEPGPDAEYVGIAFCGGPNCHGSMITEMKALRHSHYLSDPQYKDAAGCELCHGRASNHVSDPAHRRISRFIDPTPANARRINEACLKCHQETLSKPHYQATEHTRLGMSCASCHEVHYDLKTPFMLRFPGVDGPAGRPHPGIPLPKAAPAAPGEGATERGELDRGSAALARLALPTGEAAQARHSDSHGALSSGIRQVAAPDTAPAAPPAAPGATPETPAAPGEGAAPVGPPNLPRLEQAAKTRVPIPEWRTSFRRDPEAVTEGQAVNELCASCHRRQLSELRQFSHHPVFEGRVNCTDCHDAHHELQRSRRGGMLKKRTVAETCFQCHEQRRGPFIFEHEPVKAGGVGDDCLECHRPHGSPNRKLAVLFSRGLCLQCHTDIAQDPPHRSRPGDCWRSGCHTAVHGSNHSGLLFTE